MNPALQVRDERPDMVPGIDLSDVPEEKVATIIRELRTIVGGVKDDSLQQAIMRHDLSMTASRLGQLKMAGMKAPRGTQARVLGIMADEAIKFLLRSI